MSIEQFVEQNIDLVDDSNFTKLYYLCLNDDRGSLTEALYACGIDPLPSMTAIPAWFASRSNITSITIPDGVTTIEYAAFNHCRSLTSVTIPDSVISIDFSAFFGCRSLTSITIPDKVTTINNSLFSECTKLTSVTIGSSVTYIGSGAFYGCSSLTNVTIPHSVANIYGSAFRGCSSLTSVTIPDSVTKIDVEAFRDCGHLQITYSGTTQQWEKLVGSGRKRIFFGTTYVCNCSDGTVKKSK